MRTSSGLGSGFTADRAIGSAWSSVASSEDLSVSVVSLGRGTGCSDLERLAQRPVSKVRPPLRGGGGGEGARLPVMLSATERKLSTRTEFKNCARPGSLADDANGALTLRVPDQNSVGGPLGLGGNPCRPRAWAACDCSQLRATSGRTAVTRRVAAGRGRAVASALTASPAHNFLRSAGSFASSPTYCPATTLSAKLPADLHAGVGVTAPSHDATPGTTTPTASLALTAGQTIRAVPSSLGFFPVQHPQVMAPNFQACARPGSLADGANGALNLRAPRNGAGGPYSLAMLPAPESGAARVSSSSPALGRGAGCSDLERFEQRPVSKVRPPVRGGGVSEGARFPVIVSATERELSTRTEFMRTAANNLVRSAGSFASSPTYRPFSPLSAKLPVDLHASVSVTVSSLDASRGTTESASSLAPRATHSSLPIYLARWAGRSGGDGFAASGAPG